MFRSYLILLLAVAVSAQNTAPDWLKESWRNEHYQKSEWYTGFAMDKMTGQPNSNSYQTIEKEAQNKLSESIIVSIKGSSTIQISSHQTQKSDTYNMNYDKSIVTTSNAVLAKVDVKSYFDKKTGYIYGFAAVKKKDLADFYRSSINSIFAFADKEFIRMEVLEEQGKKNSAFERIAIIEDSLKNVSYWGSMLQLVESDNSYIEREQDFWQKLNNAKKSLEHGTSVNLDVSGIADVDYFKERLGAQMQEKQCNCTIAQSAKEADYDVKIRVKIGNCIENNTNNYGQVYCYAGATVTVNNQKFQKPLDVKIPEAKGGWGNRNKEKATEQATKDLINSLAEKIIHNLL